MSAVCAAAQETGGETVTEARLGPEWWLAFERGSLLVQSCESCDRRQFPPGEICRSCHALGGLSFEAFDGSVSCRAVTTVTTPATQAFADAVPFVLCTFESAEGIRLSLPTCGNTMAWSASANEPAAVTPDVLPLCDGVELQLRCCGCEALRIPHVAVLRKE